MTKTHAELLGCPRCGKPPVHILDTFDGTSEDYEEIYCDNSECTALASEDLVKHWNTRFNKEAEFLEELKEDLEKKRKFNAQFIYDDRSQRKVIIYQEILNKIEQFQAEQKQQQLSEDCISEERDKWV